VVSLAILELTAQIVPREDSPIPASIHQKLSIGAIAFLGESMQERRRGTDPAAAVYLDFQQELRLRIDGGVQPLFVSIDLDPLFLILSDIIT